MNTPNKEGLQTIEFDFQYAHNVLQVEASYLVEQPRGSCYKEPIVENIDCELVDDGVSVPFSISALPDPNGNHAGLHAAIHWKAIEEIRAQWQREADEAKLDGAS